MPPETQYEEDESEFEAALAAPRAVKPVAPDAGTEYADDAELDAALARPADISQQVRSEAARKVEGSVSEEDFDAAAKGSKVTELPVQNIEGTVPKKPWYERFIPNGEKTRAFVHGAGAGATANWGEEGAAGLMSLLPQPEDPEGIPREYAAGSQYADTHKVLENENKALREAHPAAFGAGEMVGAAPGAIATGGAGPMSTARLVGTAAAQGALAGSGYDTENRARGAAVGAGAGAATAGMLKGASQGLDKMAQNVIGKADELIVQTFMTPAQRAAYQKAHGLDSMRQLGADAREAGLFKTAILPPRAATVAKRANEVMAKSGDQISGFEDGLIQQGIDPQVNIKPVADELRTAADEMKLPAIGAADDASKLADQADLLEARNSGQPFTPVRQDLPFSEASKLKRLLGKQINWDKNPRARQVDQGTEEARKLAWRGTTQQIDQALANDPRVDPAKFAEYGKAKKDFSVSATAFDPAVSMMERENEMGLGARDLMAATAFGGGNPLVGGLASMANKNMAGAVPAMQSNNLRRFAGVASGPGVLSPNKQVGPLRAFLRNNAGLAPAMRGDARVTGIADANRAVDLVRSFDGDTEKANEETKKQLNELLPGGPK